MELLSPAGSYAALKCALSNGADAVYFGGNLFNARLGAQNFDNDSVKEAIALCHAHRAKAFITMNTLTHDRDILPAVSFAAFLYENGTDAVIVQDLGLLSLIKTHIPELEIHASTQMGISNLAGVLECEALGVKRVVLSRELSLSDIAYIHENTKMPLEVFVHGAMCMSFSGGCLFSSMVGGRSGNCGACAQPCRKYAAIYHIPSEKELNFSMADMCMIDHLDALKRAGASSLKIEGRMKKPEYIAAVTHAYRRALDGASPEEISELKREMYSVFNRGEFTTGYYFGDNPKTDRTAKASPDPQLLKTISEREPYKKDFLDMKLTVHAGKCAILEASSSQSTVKITGQMAQAPKNPITEATLERFKSQLSKLGDSAYFPRNISLDITGFIPVSALNDMRRRAVEELSEASCKEKINLPESLKLARVENKDNTDFKLRARVMNLEQAKAAYKAGANEITIEYGLFSADEIEALQPFRKKTAISAALPVALISREAEIRAEKLLSPEYFDAIEINNIGQLKFAKRFMRITGGLQLNVFNAHTAKLLLECGISSLTLSPELNAPQINEIMRYISAERLELHTYGRGPLFNLFHCPIKEHMGCRACKNGWHTMYDAEGRAFPITGMRSISPCDIVRLYNCFPHDISPLLKKLSVLPQTLVLSFTDEDSGTVFSKLDALIQRNFDPLPGTTRGYMNR